MPTANYQITRMCLLPLGLQWKWSSQSLLLAGSLGATLRKEHSESSQKHVQTQQFDFIGLCPKEITQNIEKAASQDVLSGIIHIREKSTKEREKGRKQFNNPGKGKLTYGTQFRQMFVVNKNERGKK